MHLWDDIPGPLHHHPVSDPETQGCGHCRIMQGSLGHYRSTERNWGQVGDGNEEAGSADRDRDG